jgi:hypothetical protein
MNRRAVVAPSVLLNGYGCKGWWPLQFKIKVPMLFLRCRVLFYTIELKVAVDLTDVVGLE